MKDEGEPEAKRQKMQDPIDARPKTATGNRNREPQWHPTKTRNKFANFPKLDLIFCYDGLHSLKHDNMLIKMHESFTLEGAGENVIELERTQITRVMLCRFREVDLHPLVCQLREWGLRHKNLPHFDNETIGDSPIKKAKDGEVNRVVLIYPRDGKNSVTLHEDDMKRLDEGEFLNDSLIEFFIRYVTLNSPPEAVSRFYIFNTFFYQQLSAKDTVSKKLDPDAAFLRVKRWTNKVDIFSKQFLIVPINEKCVLLYVVWNPKALLLSQLEDDQVENEVRSDTQESYFRSEAKDKLQKSATEKDPTVIYAKVGKLNRPTEVVDAILQKNPMDTFEFGSLEEIRYRRLKIRSLIEKEIRKQNQST
ncbi:hypothetical protein HDU76_011596 [Blyttiomyces sp. JEL0837]|nr:hypothetical protein HDU76_011596 [Blyttiomyces sp. JEL0837]